jgi:hypothetical protein
MSRTAYIVGKIAGLPQGCVKDKFNFIANRLIRLGYKVVRPAAITDDTQPWADAAHNDIEKMIQCDEVHLLPDWQDSLWARFERELAISKGMQIVYH